MNKILFTTNLIMGIVLSRFAISKLAGWDISVQAFIEMAKPIGIDPTFFRISTGILLTVVVLGYFTVMLLSIFNKPTCMRIQSLYKKWATRFNLLGLLTMVGALISEFSLRLEPKWLLVYIALGIVILSSLNLLLINKQYKLRSQQLKN